jgi:hypothetical protein
VYGGDGNNAGSASPTLSQVVQKTAAQASLASQNPATAYGQSATFTATVTGQSPTGTVAFTDGVTTISGCNAVVLTLGSAQCTTSALTVGNHSIAATYSGDGNNSGATSNTLAQSVSKASTTTAVATSASPSTFAQSVTFTATVAGQGASGSVQFKDGASTIGGCSMAVLSGGQAQCTTASLATGNHSITAVYGGDASNAGSTSAVLVQTVNPAPTTTGLGSSANPSAYGQAVTLTASVVGVAPTGTVAFSDGGASIAACASVALSGAGQAQCALSSLAVGMHNLTATYAGDANNAASVSGVVAQVVNAAPTTTTLQASPNPSTFGQAVTFMATVLGQSPTGNVTFKDGVALIGGCASVALASGQAQCTTTSLAVGSHAILAQYDGDANHAGSASAALTQAVDPDIAAATLTLSANGPVHRGQTSMVSATVTGGSMPTGTVTVQGAGGGCTVTLAGGTGTCMLTPGVVGAGQMIMGSYAGDATHESASAQAMLTVISTLDVDVNGASDALTDGLLAIRYLFGLAGQALVAGAVGDNATVTTPAAIAQYLGEVAPLLDIDGDGNADALTDGLLVIRYLFGLRGAALIQQAVATGATRTTAADIEAYIASLIGK